MKPAIVHQGGALCHAGEVIRLKDLLPADRLELGQVELVGAEPEGEQALRLVLGDGRTVRVPLPCPPGPQPSRRAELVVRNAAQVLTLVGPGLGLLQGGAVACGQGRVLAVAEEPELAHHVELAPDVQILDARGGLVAPGLVDAHTHPVFAGQRHVEFGLKAEGRSYMEIHRSGGGILSTVRATRQATFDDLLQTTLRNLTRLLSWGVTTCEAKSGYALEVAGELRLLEVLRTAGDRHPVDVEPTLLAAHAVPPEHAGDRAGYVARITDEIIPAAARGSLARYCDAYCEEGAFSVDDVERIFSAARTAGMGLKIHAEQFTRQGGAALAARLDAVSADHLEAISAEDVAALARSRTTAVLLPGAALACRCPWPPARELLDAGVHVALGTDLNPGSSMTASLPLMMSLACMQLHMSCEEAWRAVTVEAARSLGRDDIGRLAPGCQADLVVFEAPDYRYIPYHYGENHARFVVKRGRIVLERQSV